MDFSDVSGGPWSESGGSDQYANDPAAAAFAAYARAWEERERTGNDSATILTDALEAARVDPLDYADGTALHTSIFTAWAKGKPAGKLQTTMIGYRLRRLRESVGP